MIINNYLYNLEHYLRGYFEVPKVHHENNVFLASFPKSGNTWFRFLLSNIIAQQSNYPFDDVDFHTIDFYSPDVRNNRGLANAVLLSSQPTFLKTHFGFIKKMADYKSIVLYRSPDKVIMSYKHYLENTKGIIFSSNDGFINHWKYGLSSWLNFHKRWLENKNTIFIKYEDALENTQVLISALYNKLGYDVDDNQINTAVKKSTRENMRNILSVHGDPHANNRNYDFVRSISSSERGVLTEQQYSHIHSNTVDIMKMLDARRLNIL